MTNGVPPMPPGPAGPPIGVHGPERSYSVDIIVCSVITSVIGSAFVGLRFYTRAVLRRVLGLDDWLILLAQVFSIATSACFIQEAVLGLGKHWWWVDVSNLLPLSRVGWIAVLFYELSLWFSQTAILVLYLRLWTHPWMLRCTWALIAVITAYNIFVFTSIFTACIPLEAYWDFTVRATYCHAKSIWLANTYLHIATDFLIYFLPMPIIFCLTLPRHQKALIFVLFAFGFFVCMISIIRLVYLLMTLHTTDILYDNTTTAFWTTIETNATVVIACIMTINPLLSRWFPTLMQLRSDEMQAANGHVPTIGSTPTRPPNAGRNEHRSWNSFGTNSVELERDSGRVETDLEATGHLNSRDGSSDFGKAPSRAMAERAPSLSQECLYRGSEDCVPGRTQR